MVRTYTVPLVLNYPIFPLECIGISDSVKLSVFYFCFQFSHYAP